MPGTEYPKPACGVMAAVSAERSGIQLSSYEFIFDDTARESSLTHGVDQGLQKPGNEAAFNVIGHRIKIDAGKAACTAHQCAHQGWILKKPMHVGPEYRTALPADRIGSAARGKCGPQVCRRRVDRTRLSEVNLIAVDVEPRE